MSDNGVCVYIYIYNMCFILTKIVTANRLNPQYVFPFTHPPSILCFTFTYLCRDTRLFNDKFCVTVFI